MQGWDENTQLKQLLITIKKHTCGSMGIGSLIVFLAVVLVAGIAASILIQTSNELEMQSTKTGQETRSEISSDIDVMTISGEFNSRVIDGTSYSRFHNMTILVNPLSASTINLNDVVIEISNGSKLCVLFWDTSKYADQTSGSGVFSTTGLFDLNASKFGIIKVEDQDGSCTAANPVINKGDKVVLTVNLSACFNGLSFREDVRGQVIPEYGSPGIFIFRTPTSALRSVVVLM